MLPPGLLRSLPQLQLPLLQLHPHPRLRPHLRPRPLLHELLLTRHVMVHAGKVVYPAEEPQRRLATLHACMRDVESVDI